MNNQTFMVVIYTRDINLWWCNVPWNIENFWTFASHRGPVHYRKL